MRPKKRGYNLTNTSAHYESSSPEAPTLGKKIRQYFGYSTNVHKGENLRQIYRFLKDYTLRDIAGRLVEQARRRK